MAAWGRRPQAALLLASLAMLAACADRSPLWGHWTVDLEATIEQARRDGIPSQAEPEIREVFERSLLEINEQALVMSVADIPGDPIARRYRIVGEQAGCYQMEINGTPGTHDYCVRGDHLLVRDPTTPLTVVFKRDKG